MREAPETAAAAAFATWSKIEAKPIHDIATSKEAHNQILAK